MESQSPPHQLTPILPDSLTAKSGCANWSVEFYDTVQPSCDDVFNFIQNLEDEQQQPPPSPPPSSKCKTFAESSDTSSESVKSMDVEFYRCLRAGHIDALQSKLQDEEDNLLVLDQVTPQLNTPLHIVALLGFDQMIKLILDRRPQLLNQKNVNRETALHLAAGAGHLAAVESIAEFVPKGERGFVFMSMNRDNDRALHIAVRHKHKEVAQYLIGVCPQASYLLNRRLESPLFMAAELGDLELVTAMIEAPVTDHMPSILQSGKSVVFAAVTGGNLGVLEAILNKHKFLINYTKISKEDQTRISLLSYAAFKGNIQMIRYILTHFPGCTYERDSIGTFPIHMAAAAGHKMAIEEFLQFHPDSRELLTSKQKQNILHMAAAHGKDHTVSYILSKPDFDELINARDGDGNTPLHCAVAKKCPAVVYALTRDKRVKLDLVNNEGKTAMDVASKFEDTLPSFREQLTWMALRYAGAPRPKFQQSKTPKKSEPAIVENYKDRVNTLSVVATLVTTMSFAAGFTLPGGSNGSDPDRGLATFLKRRIFQLFMISNSIALYTSVLDVLILIFAMLGDVKLLQVSLNFAIPLLAVSLAMMSISFMSAAYLVVSGLKWLGIVVWVLGSIFLAAVLSLFVLLSLPVSAKHGFTRYIIHVPFRVLLHMCEWKTSV